MVGAIISVAVTDGENIAAATCEEEVEPFGIIEIESAVATKVNEIEVTLAYSVDSSDTEVKLTKGTSDVPATVTWDDDFKVATITTSAKLSNGTYTVTLTSEEDETNTDSEDIEIKDQYVAEIVITTDTALTDPDNKRIAYSSYDVFDQYGESLRASTSITWAGSATITGDKSTGKLTLTKTTANDWIYNEQIYITGVYAKTGVSVQKTLTVGTEQSLDTLEIAGFVKKGTTEIVQTLPADFKSNTYYLIFRALDQNGTTLDADDVEDDDVTFVSDNVLVIKEIGALVEGGLTVEGETYAAAFVEPGIKVSDGGAVTVTAIANKTGNKTEISMIVGVDQVVASFALSAPTAVVADGDTDVEIPFVAKDSDGNEITDFVTLAKQETFNTLTFHASEGTLTLAEQADGSAKLLWSDTAAYQTPATKWADSHTTDGIDRPISLTAIVVGGGTDNEMIDVSDARRPDAIIAVDMDEVYTEDATITFTSNTNKFESFQFIDQYGKTITGTKGTAKKYGDSTGFFAQANAGASANFVDTDLKNYTFGIRIKYAGSGKIEFTNSEGDTLYGDGVTNETVVITGTATAVYTTWDDIASAATGEGFKFEIAKMQDPGANSAKNWDTLSTTKYVSTTVVDLSQVKSFTISSLNKFYLGEVENVTESGRIAADKQDELNSDAGEAIAAAAGGLTNTAAYQQEVVVKGTYNGKTVTIPTGYYSVTGNKVGTGGGLDDNVVDTIISMNIKDLYDATSAKGTAKDATGTLKVTLRNINGDTEEGDMVLADDYAYNALSGDALIEAAADDWADGKTAAQAAALLSPESTIPAGTTVDDAVAILIANNLAIAAVDEDDLGVPDEDDDGLTKAAILEALVALEDDDPAENIAAEDLLDPVYDTVSTNITISDQAPSAATIDGLADSATLKPTLTGLEFDTIEVGIRKTSTTAVSVKDQYGVAMAGAEIAYKATDIVENESAYAANNFAVSGNDTKAISITGAERADTFTLVLTSGSAEATIPVTVGADTEAKIEESDNDYKDVLIPVLEEQRLAGLG